jgi:hypothetical protein
MSITQWQKNAARAQKNADVPDMVPAATGPQDVLWLDTHSCVPSHSRGSRKRVASSIGHGAPWHTRWLPQSRRTGHLPPQRPVPDTAGSQEDRARQREENPVTPTGQQPPAASQATLPDGYYAGRFRPHPPSQRQLRRPLRESAASDGPAALQAPAWNRPARGERSQPDRRRGKTPPLPQPPGRPAVPGRPHPLHRPAGNHLPKVPAQARG